MLVSGAVGFLLKMGSGTICDTRSGSMAVDGDWIWSGDEPPDGRMEDLLRADGGRWPPSGMRDLVWLMLLGFLSMLS